MDRTKAIENLMRIRLMHEQRVFGAINDEEDEALGMAIKALEGKDTNVPANSALDHIHHVVAENAFNKGYDVGYKEGYERGRKDAATSLAKQITSKFDEVLGVDDVLEEIDNLEAVAKGELP